MYLLKEMVLAAVVALDTREISEYLLGERVLVALVAKIARQIPGY